MAISYQESAEMSCPVCQATFAAAVWLLLDIDEQPAAAADLARDALNTVNCPQCGESGPAGAPLMVHDGLLRRVLFAPTPAAADHQVREQARELHALLVGSIADDARAAYLADVEICADAAGLGRQVERLLRRRAARGTPAAAASAVTDAAPGVQLIETEPAVAEEAPLQPLQRALEALLAADDAEQLQSVVTQYPLLLEAATAATIGQLALAADSQGEAQIAAGLRRAAQLLRQVGGTAEALTVLPPAVLAELLTAADEAAVELVVGRHPLLLDPRVDALLADETTAALNADDSRLADALEQRREVLQRLRGEPQLLELEAAVEALLLAESETAVTALMQEQPLLLSDAAEDALWRIAAEARRGGDEELARYAVECRTMVRRIRRTLQERD